MDQPIDRLQNRLRQRREYVETPAKPDVFSLLQHAETVAVQQAFLEHKPLFVNARDEENGRGNILHAALRSKRYDLIPFFTAHAPELLKEKKTGGQTPLQDAISGDAPASVVSKMIRRGAEAGQTLHEGKTLLHLAVDNGRADLLQILAEAGLDVNARDHRGNTPVLQAAKHGDAESLKTLLSLAADPTVQDQNGYTPLYTALQTENTDITDILLARRDVVLSLNETVTQQEGLTALMVAAAHAPPDTVRQLVELGANINARDKRGTPVIGFAMKNKHPRAPETIIRFLLSKGADIPEANMQPAQQQSYAPRYGREADDYGWRPSDPHRNTPSPGTAAVSGSMLHEAIADKELRGLAKILISYGMDTESTDRQKRTPLMIAVENLDYGAAAMLLRNGAKTETPTGEDPLVNTLARKPETEDSLRLLKLLHKHGVPLEKFDRRNVTPLYQAADTGNIETVKFLLKNNVAPDTKTTNFAEDTAFMTACKSKNLEIAAILLKHGADPNTRDKQGNTALHNAANTAQFETLKFLCENGADLSAVNDQGETPLMRALSGFKNQECIAYLIKKTGLDLDQKNAEGRTALHDLVLKGSADILDAVLTDYADSAKKPDLDARDREEKTPLMLAAQKRDCRMMETLLKHGAGINATDNLGRTPLYFAMSEFSDSAVDFLIQQGANLRILPKGDTSSYLHLAAENGNEKLVKKFTDAKLPVNRPDAQGNTPLHLAVKYDNYDAAAHLLEKGADPKLKNNVGFTPIELAAQRNLHPVKNLIQSYLDGKPLPRNNRYGYNNRNYW